jgi:magnesium transporter
MVTLLDTIDLQSAGENVVANVPIAAPDDSAEAIRETLLGRRFASAVDVAVCDHGRLVGVIRLEDLLAAPDDLLAHELMDAAPPVVGHGADREQAAWQAVRHGEGSLAVIDTNEHFVGFIPPSRLLAIMLWEHYEDTARLSGFLHDTQSARTASEEPVVRRFWHRVPWLLIGLMGATLAAVIVSSFEEELKRNVILAFFLPGIVYMADAVGTQTEALVIRGLSVGVSIRHVLRQETITGLLVGVALAVAFYPIVRIGWGDADAALVVSLSLFAAVSVASVVAMSLPYALHRLGTDPAYGSGPLATVIQDLLSILIYLGIALAIL